MALAGGNTNAVYGTPEDTLVEETEGVETSTPNLDQLTASIEQLKITAFTYMRNAPGFFTPYKNPQDFVKTLLCPISAPLLLGVFAAVAAIAALIAAITLAVSLMVAAAAAVIQKKEVAIISLAIAGTSALVAIAALFLAPTLAILAVAIIPATIVNIFTRTAATGVSAIRNCFSDDESEVGSDDESTSSMLPA